MKEKLNSILVATNFSIHSKKAFEHAVFLARLSNARITFLHVIEKIPETYENRIKIFLGKEGYENVVEKHFDEAKNMLIGKIGSKEIVCLAMEEVCYAVENGNHSDNQVKIDIVIENGDIADQITSNANKIGSDLIVMGASKGIMSGTAIGAHIKEVLKRTKVPVLVVPPAI